MNRMRDHSLSPLSNLCTHPNHSKSTRGIKRYLGKTRTEQMGNLLDECPGGKEGIVFLRELLDELFIFVEPAVELDYWCMH